MKLSARDRRALLILGVFLIGLFLYVRLTDPAPEGTADDAAAIAAQGIAAAEKRLARMRQLAAQVPGREEVYKQAAAELALREKRILQAGTAAQAQAQLLDIVRRVAKAQNPPVEIRASEFGPVRALGEDYGEVPVTVTMECGIDQMLNLMAELTAQQPMVATNELRVYSANQKQKTVNVRLFVTAAVAKRLVPEKKGAAF
jgi:hypothetical protein